MKYADEQKLTKEEWTAVATEMNSEDVAQKAELLTAAVSGRLSRKRCKAKLIELAKAGEVHLKTPDALYAWTFGAATVAGARPDGIPGKQHPVLDITQAQWDKITPKRIAEVIQEHTTEKRAADVVLALMYGKLFRPTAEDVIYLTNERVTIEGVKAPAQQRKQFDIMSLIADIEVG